MKYFYKKYLDSVSFLTFFYSEEYSEQTLGMKSWSLITFLTYNLYLKYIKYGGSHCLLGEDCNIITIIKAIWWMCQFEIIMLNSFIFCWIRNIFIKNVLHWCDFLLNHLHSFIVVLTSQITPLNVSAVTLICDKMGKWFINFTCGFSGIFLTRLNTREFLYAEGEFKYLQLSSQYIQQTILWRTFL